MGLHWEMAEAQAELVKGELKQPSLSEADGHLQVTGQVLIYLFNICARGKLLVNAPPQLTVVAAIAEQDGLRRLSVTAGTSCLLEIGLDAVGTVDMDHESYIRLVDAHTEGIGSHDDTCLVALPVLLPLVARGVVETGVVEGGSPPYGPLGGRQGGFVDIIRDFLGTLAAAHIDDGAAFLSLQYAEHFSQLVLRTAHDVGQVLALERHAEDVECRGTRYGGRGTRGQLLTNIVHHFRRSGGCEGKDGHGLYLADGCYVEVGRAEVVAPLADAMGFIDGDEADVHVAQFGDEEVALQSFGRHVEQLGVAEDAVFEDS